MNTVTIDHIVEVRNVVERSLGLNTVELRSSGTKLRLGSGMELLLSQLLIPVLASVCASAIYDLIKGRAIRTLTKRDLDDALQLAIGTAPTPIIQLPDNIRIQLEELLAEYGASAQKLDEILRASANIMNREREPDGERSEDDI